MSYQKDFYSQYQRLSNPSSQYYQRANQDIMGNLNASSPTINSLLGVQMAMGGSYKGSLEAAKKQRQGIETRNAETANRGTNQLYVGSQGQANQALQGAQGAYEYEDSQPGFWDYLAGPISTVAGALAPGVGGLLGGFFGKKEMDYKPQDPFQPYQPPNSNFTAGGFNNPTWGGK